MDKSMSVHLADDDQIRVVHQVRRGCLDGYPVLWVKSTSGSIDSLDIFPGIAGLRRIVAEGAAYLAEHDEGPDGSADRTDIVPAEAATGCEPRPLTDELMEIAEDFGRGLSEPWPPRGEDFDDPSDAEIAAGVRNAPGQVP